MLPAQSQPDRKALFERRCGGCHALDRDKEGPRLGGGYGRAAGSVASFEYSDALKKSKIKWTDETLDKWLTNTENLVPDNDMTFRVPKADERGEKSLPTSSRTPACKPGGQPGAPLRYSPARILFRSAFAHA